MSDDLDFACPVCKKEPSRGIFVGAKIYHDECLINELIEKFKAGDYTEEDIKKILKKVKNIKISKAVGEATYGAPEPEFSQEEIDAAFAASMEQAEGEAATEDAEQAALEAAENNSEESPTGSSGGLPAGSGGGLPKGSGGGKTQTAQAISVAQMPSYVGAPVVGGGGGIPKIEVSYQGFRFKVCGSEEFVEKNYKEFGEKYIDMLICDKFGILEPGNATEIEIQQETNDEIETSIDEEETSEVEKPKAKKKKSPSKKSSAKKEASSTIPPVKPVHVRPKKVKKKKK
jgi:hypothetical protein